MNILVIGNGFDLAHGLPTRYTDFLDWVNKYNEFYTYASRKRTASYTEVSEPILHYFNTLFYQEEGASRCNEIYRLVKDNIWLEYFKLIPVKKGWIDFESEISNVIQSLDNDMHEDSNSNVMSFLDVEMIKLSNNFLNKEYYEYTLVHQGIDKYNNKRCKCITYKEIRDRLLTDLNRLIRALEIYLCDYIEKIEIEKKSLDIESLSIDHILSFNYTDTYEKIYGNNKDIEYDYIHGKGNIDNTIESNNMVLGIDEYLPEDRKNKDIEFIAFKKYYQRIHKQTGCKYKEWVDEIQRDYVQYLRQQEKAERIEAEYVSDDLQKIMNELAASAIRDEKCKIHNLYIFGHSLDVTDRDILRDLILNDNIHTTIFYLNKEVMGQQIANLVRVIGQDELIKRTGGSTRTIEFKLQSE